jgi:hypothetical protein
MNSLDLSVILTAHREGLLVGVSAQSALAAISTAELLDIRTEMIVVLDRADELTASTAKNALGSRARYIATDEGDPGAARNIGIAAARGTCAAFLDGDDLWSENWLADGWSFNQQRPDAIAHAACLLYFGRKRNLFWHADSETALCDQGYLAWSNYWDALSLARTEIYRGIPFRRNDLHLGFGHEDWHWNRVTLNMGIAHKPVPGTIHFKRVRPGSQMEKVAAAAGETWPCGSNDRAPT